MVNIKEMTMKLKKRRYFQEKNDTKKVKPL